MIVLYYLLLALVGGFLYRTRGGFDPVEGFPGGTQSARAVWCVPTGALVGFLTGDILVGVLTALTTFLGLMIPHGRQMDLGRLNGDALEDAWHLFAIGQSRLFLTLLPAAVTLDYRLLLVSLGAVFHSLAYWIGWKLPVANASRGDNRAFIDCETAWAEAFWGAAQWAVIGAAFTVIG